MTRRMRRVLFLRRIQAWITTAILVGELMNVVNGFSSSRVPIIEKLKSNVDGIQSSSQWHSNKESCCFPLFSSSSSSSSSSNDVNNEIEKNVENERKKKKGSQEGKRKGKNDLARSYERQLFQLDDDDEFEEQYRKFEAKRQDWIQHFQRRINNRDEMDDILDEILLKPNDDPPADWNHAMTKAIESFAAPPSTLYHQEKELKREEAMDNVVADLESRIRSVARKFQWDKAHELDMKMARRHLNDGGLVLQANSRFYRAFSDKNFTAMKDVWHHDGTVQCILPGLAPRVGANAVLDTYRELMDDSLEKKQLGLQTWILPSKIRIVVRGNMAIITCREDVYGKRYIALERKRRSELLNSLQATNIFRKIGGTQWKLVHHHAAWHHQSPMSDYAYQSNNGLFPDQVEIQQLQQDDQDQEEEDDDDDDFFRDEDDDKNVGPYYQNSFLKTTPEIALYGRMFKPSFIDPDEQSPKVSTHRQFPSSSRLGNDISEIFSEADPDNYNHRDKKRYVLRSKPRKKARKKRKEEDEEYEEEEEDDEYEDDEDEDDEDDDDDEDDERIKVIRFPLDDLQNPEKETAPITKDSLRQGCIQCLRKLCDKDVISPSEKRILLTDIITCSARGEFSMVEVAYELLYAEGGAADATSEEEFADQCRVFAQQLETNTPTIS